ncbi:MAG: cyclic nucleotide-binding domain-containing protein [Deltaproteobacteria bacterium]|nr:cyclic nucleotide-binding domain-containing protein [Deltaproteobacteria bacterium]
MKNQMSDTITLFTGLTDEEVAKLESYMEPKRFAPLEAIFLEEMEGNAIYLVKEGTVKISKIADSEDGGENSEAEKVMTYFKSGDIFGEMSFIDNLPRSASAYAVEDCQLYIFKRSAFERMIEEDPKFAIKVLLNISKIISQRLRRADEILIYLATQLDVYFT